MHTDNTVLVTWDARGSVGRHVTKITLLNSGYSGEISGICGNSNGIEADDHYPKGMSKAGSDTEVGNSHIISELL